MYLLKGSVIRKRYILVFWESESEKMDKYLYNYYEIKRKYKKGKLFHISVQPVKQIHYLSFNQ